VNLRRRLRLPWPFVFATKRISLQIPLTVTGRDEHDSVFASGVKLYSRNQPRILPPSLASGLQDASSDISFPRKLRDARRDSLL
jgi:hypothetical protein